MPKTTVPNANPDDLITGGEAFEKMLSKIDIESQIKALKHQILETKSPSKRDQLVKKLKYIAGLQKLGMKPNEAYILHTMPVVPPSVRPTTQTGGNKIEYADSNYLYRDHMLVNNAFKDIKDVMTPEQLATERKALYDGAKAIFGLGDAISGYSRGKQLKGFIQQIAPEGGPKGGFFQDRLLKKKQDFSGRATIYAEPNLGFNEAAIPKDMLWDMYAFHVIRDLVRNGYDYVSARKAVQARDTAATNSFNKLIKQIPVILNRAPTLMRTNITAHYPIPIEGRTLGINPLHLPLYAADFDGDAQSLYVPMTPEAIEEAKQKLLPQAHIYDYRKGQGESLVAPGHEAVIGSMHMTEPDLTKNVVEFKSESDVLNAFKRGEIDENTPIRLLNETN